MRRTIVCLANSYKHGGRCVAGICINNGKWVRLRGSGADGALEVAECMLDDGSEAQPLDLIEAELQFALPSDCHPEDWQIAPVPWQLEARPVSLRTLLKVTNAADKATTILRGYRDRMTEREIQRKPLEASLVLVQPSEVHWWIRETGGKRKHRALFQRHHVTYDFALTDPRWLERLAHLPPGIYPHSQFISADCETWLTISLSEPWYGWHYKLVAAVIVVPRD